MKKIKLLLAAMAAMVGMSANAQLTSGTVYWLQDTGTGQFISAGASWGTRATVKDVGGLGFEATYVSDGVYTLKNVMLNKVHSLSKGLGSNLYVDNGTPAQWTLTASGGGYTIKNGDKYLCNNQNANALYVKDLGTTTDAAQATVWKFLTRTQYDAAIQTYKNGLAASIATSAGLSATTVTALEDIITDPNQYISKDYTSSITNASLANNWDGWTHGGTPGSNRGEGAGVGSGCAEFWNGCGYAKQTVSGLPQGIYKIEFAGTYRPGNANPAKNVPSEETSSPAFGYANNAKVELVHWIDVSAYSNGRSTFYRSDYNNTIYTYVGSDGNLELGIVQDYWNNDNNNAWCPFGQFKLTYYTDQVDDSDISALIATIPAEGTIPTAVRTNLLSLESTLEGSKTVANYYALSAAITAANALVAPYATYNSVKTAVLALDDDASVFTGSATVDVSAAETAVASATTVEAINAAIAQLRTAGTTFLSAVTVNDGKAFDLTGAYITNAAPWASTDGWTCPVAATPNATARAAEFWNKSGVSISQTMASLPAGYYTLKAQAFARTGCSPIYIFAGTGATFSDYANKQELIKRSNSECSTMAAAGEWFDAGNGWNTLTFQNESAGTFTIGLNDEFVPDGSHGDGHDGWLIWREFQLNYLGTEPISVLAGLYGDALAAAEAACDDATYANVQGAERAALVAAIADTPSATSESYKAKTSALIVATNTFIDPTVVSNWNSYATNYPAEKAKADAISTSIADGITATSSTTAAEAATAVNRLKVAEYNYVVDNYTTAIELGDWTQEGGTAFNTTGGQHWSGNPSTGYWEQTSANYQAASWAISFNQTIELPAGSYIFKVAGRHSGSSNMALEVTNADTKEAIGSVNDFPTGGTGKGIATDGTANFTDGTFANGGSGYGFQWRYVPFTLDATTNVKVAITASASTTAQWISFCDYTVQAIPSVEVQTIAYNQAKAAAEAACDDATYTNVQGTDRSNLLSAIAADKGSTVESIDAATAALRTTTATFIAGVASWNEYATAMSVVVPRTLPYASSSKESALETAVTTTVNTASEAATQAPIILTANRLYVESNALAERVGAVDMTSKIGQANAPASFGEISSWTVTDNNGTHNSTIASNEQFTQGDGTGGGAYYDGGDLWNATYTANYKQEVTLNPGKYLLTVTSRASAGTTKFELYADDNTLEMVKIGAGVNTGVFGRGWNDQSLEFVINDATKAVEIGVNIEQDEVHNWYSFTRFRLVQIEAYNIVVSENTTSTFVATPEPANVTLTRTIKAGTWNTFVVPFDINNTELKAAFGNEVEVAEFSDGGREEAVVLTFTPMLTPAITANEPVLLKTNTEGTSYVFENRAITTGTPTATGTYIDFVGTYEASTLIPAGNYFISGNKLWKSDGTKTTIKGTRAYIDATKVPASDVKLFIDDIETSIEEINGDAMENGLIYNLAGQRIQKMQKGINIVNGKKILY